MYFAYLLGFPAQHVVL